MAVQLYAVLVILVTTCVLVVLLLLPLPTLATKLIVALVKKLDSPLLWWPTRMIFVLLTVATISSFYDMRKHENIERPKDQIGIDVTEKNRFRAERNFYIHFITWFLVLICWRIQVLLASKITAEEEREDARKKLDNIKKGQ